MKNNCLQELLAINSQNARDYVDCAKKLGEFGDYLNAVKALNKSIELDPQKVFVYALRGLVKFHLQDMAGAIEDFDVFINLEPEQGEALFHRGGAKVYLGDLEGAIADYDLAILFNPKFSLAFCNRAKIKYKLGDLAAAIADYDQAIELDPAFSEAYRGRGNAKDLFGNPIAAIEDYDQAIKLNPGFSEAYSSRGAVKYGLGDEHGAKADFDLAIKFDPEFSNAYYGRGLINRSLGDQIAAKADFDLAIKFDPEFSEAYNGRGVVKLTLGDQAGAKADFDLAIQFNPQNAAAYFNRGSRIYLILSTYHARQDLLRVIYLDDKKPILAALKELFKLFTYDFPAPFIIHQLIKDFPATRALVSFQTLIAENDRNCRPILTFLRFIELAKKAPEADVKWLTIFFYLGMGDPIRAYELLDSLDDRELAVQYFLMLTAEEILHDERKSISEYAEKAALAYTGENAREWYFAGRILHFVKKADLALTCFARAKNYWPAAFAKAGINGLLGETQKTFSQGLPTIVPKENGNYWRDEVEQAVLFYDLEEEISRFSGTGRVFPRFWEIWDMSQLIEPLRKLEMDVREKWLKEVFQKYYDEAYKERKPEAKRFEHYDDEIQGKFRQLKKSKTLTNDLSLLIHSEKWLPEECAALVEYFYLAKKLPTDDVFYLYFYILQNSHNPSTAASEGVDEWLKTFAEKLLSPLFQVLGIFGEAVAAGIGEALKVLFQKFMETKHSRIPPSGDTLTDFERFRSSFKQHILDTYEDLGEETFFKLYPIQGFDKF